MGQDQTIEAIAIDTDLGQPFLDLATREPGVDHQPLATALQHQHVATTARAENDQAHLGVV